MITLESVQGVPKKTHFHNAAGAKPSGHVNGKRDSPLYKLLGAEEIGFIIG